MVNNCVFLLLVAEQRNVTQFDGKRLFNFNSIWLDWIDKKITLFPRIQRIYEKGQQKNKIQNVCTSSIIMLSIALKLVHLMAAHPTSYPPQPVKSRIPSSPSSFSSKFNIHLLNGQYNVPNNNSISIRYRMGTIWSFHQIRSMFHDVVRL